MSGSLDLLRLAYERVKGLDTDFPLVSRITDFSALGLNDLGLTDLGLVIWISLELE